LYICGYCTILSNFKGLSATERGRERREDDVVTAAEMSSTRVWPEKPQKNWKKKRDKGETRVLVEGVLMRRPRQCESWPCTRRRVRNLQPHFVSEGTCSV
jgi:hypothetical protein